MKTDLTYTKVCFAFLLDNNLWIPFFYRTKKNPRKITSFSPLNEFLIILCPTPNHGILRDKINC